MKSKSNLMPSAGEAVVGRRFEKGDWGRQVFNQVSFEECVFTNFALEQTEFLDCCFLDCSFRNVRMNLANVTGSSIRDTVFAESRLQGIEWQRVGIGLGFREVVFESCSMEYGSFAGMKCGGTKFRNCRLKEVDFSEAQARGVSFRGSDLEGAVFHRTDLSEADFSEALNYVFDPSQNTVEDALFSFPEAVGLLRKFGVKIV